MNEVSVNTIRIFALMESSKLLVRQDAGGLGNFPLKFPSIMLGTPIDKHRVRQGSLKPAPSWATSAPRLLQQVEREYTDQDSLSGDNSGWQFTDSNQKLRILIVCDEAERLQELETALGICQVNLFTATSINELRSIQDSAQFDLAAVDVSPNLIVAVLSFLRSSKAFREATILVESPQVTGNLELAGVLPRFRAMPCSRNDLLRLVCGRITPESLRSGEKRTFL